MTKDPLIQKKSKGSKPFRNPARLEGCQDCPLKVSCASNEVEAGVCCGAASGICGDGFYDRYVFKPDDIEAVGNKTENLGIRFPMKTSESLWERALGMIPGGSQTLSKAPGCFVDGVTPKYLQRGEGDRVWDVDGNQYIDYCMACFPLTLGYCVPEIDEAIRAQLKDGITFSMMHPLEIDVASRLIERIPCAEMVRFSKNGSDVTSAAVRLARHITGREKIACLGYHGFQDWYIGTTDRYFGIPEAVRQMTHPFAYNDIRSLQNLFAKHKGQIACVIMEPTLYEFPREAFLEQVRSLTEEEGALLIFDEMLTGFRLAEGGGQEFFGIIPDLATFGKGIANGMPIGVLTGAERYMRHFDKVFFSSTYGGETLTLAAAVAVLDFYRRHQVIRRLWKSGKIIMDNFNRLACERGLDQHVRVIGYPVRQQIILKDRTGQPNYLLSALFQQEMFKRGVLCYAGAMGFSYSHTDADLFYTVRVFGEALDVIAKALDSEDIRQFLQGTPSEPVFRTLRDQRQTAN